MMAAKLPHNQGVPTVFIISGILQKQKRPTSEDASRSYERCKQTSPSGKVSLTTLMKVHLGAP
jgi:hypothetical protein